jgi:nitric oxide reductase NorD protein
MDDRKSQALYNALLEIFFTDTIGSCHVETAVEFLERLPREHIGPVLKLVRLISGSVSDLLAFSFMENVEEALKHLSCSQLEDWVTEALGIYEAKGLQPAKDFFSAPGETTLRYTSRRVAMFRDSASDMRLLSAGLSQRDPRFDSAPVPHTDTETIFAPHSCSMFPEMEENHLFYRVAIAHKCAQIRYGSFLMPRDAVASLLEPYLVPGEKASESFGFIVLMKSLRKLYPQKDAASIYCLLDTIRIEHLLLSDYRGLSRNFSLLKARLREKAEKEGHDFQAGGLLSGVALWILNDYRESFFPEDFPGPELLRRLVSGEPSALDSAEALCALLGHEKEGRLEMEFPGRALPYVGTVFPDSLVLRLQERRSLVEQAFVEIVGALLAEHEESRERCEGEKEEDGHLKNRSCPADDETSGALAVAVNPGKEGQDDAGRLLRNLMLEADSETREKLSRMVREICQDLGRVPSSYVSTALDLATGAYDSKIEVEGSRDKRPVFTFYTYPEWDFRRGAYRKNWCTVKELMCPAAKGNFVAQVLERYRGQVASLRRQFELMRQDYRYVRRQRDGEEVDIDAFVEAYTDIHASLSPSENLYTRLVKDQRDIAVLFLIDMSASTEGWINVAIKESLVLLSSAMELLGDRYAIYGFSGMQRTGCQSFVIKEFDQEYDSAVEERITGINARDYTRMGPAVRHAITRLDEVDARLKILIALSDGKPEDYDEYKGPYAIEDTRMSLFEARQKGIRPFCITVDREARDYLPRMYGAANYILVPDVRLLHKRVPEIYRVLTT